MVISSVLDCESVWTLTVDILNTICNRDCFADYSLDLTLIVSFWKIAFLVCWWKQIIISRSWNWTHLQFSTQCSNGCQCVLWNFQWFLFSIMSVTVLYLGGGGLFYGTLYMSRRAKTVSACLSFLRFCYAFSTERTYLSELQLDRNFRQWGRVQSLNRIHPIHCDGIIKEKVDPRRICTVYGHRKVATNTPEKEAANK